MHNVIDGRVAVVTSFTILAAETMKAEPVYLCPTVLALMRTAESETQAQANSHTYGVIIHPLPLLHSAGMNEDGREWNPSAGQQPHIK